MKGGNGVLVNYGTTSVAARSLSKEDLLGNIGIHLGVLSCELVSTYDDAVSTLAIKGCVEEYSWLSPYDFEYRTPNYQ